MKVRSCPGDLSLLAYKTVIQAPATSCSVAAGSVTHFLNKHARVNDKQ